MSVAVPDDSSPPDDLWVIIPARGGSVSVPRKNVRLLAGRPLIAHTIGMCREVLPSERVLVVTDDEEIRAAAEQAGATVILESMPTPGTETLDTKVTRNLPALRAMGAQDDHVIATVQPTSPLTTSRTLLEAYRALSSSASVLTVAEDRHLRWRIGADGEAAPLFQARVNRQELPMEVRETGGVIAARLRDIEAAGTRVIAPVRLVPISADEAIDIDSFTDLYAAAHLMTRMRIILRTDAAPHLGMGHVYRMLAVATELARHDLTVVTSAEHELGGRFFAERPYRSETVESEAAFSDLVRTQRPDLIVLDVLDTESSLIERLRAAAPGVRIVTFEDTGSGAVAADLLVSEFVPNPSVPAERQLAGVDHAILSPAFESFGPGRPPADTVEEVLVLFGGTDPAGLAERALLALERVGYPGHVTVVRGLGAGAIDLDRSDLDIELRTDVRHMPSVIARADLAFTSAGRTVIELASLGVPSICLAQNRKELGHTHATEALGVRMLGLGTEVPDAAVDAMLTELLTDTATRHRLAANARATMARRSNHRTIGRLLDRLGFDPFPNL